ncbi:G-protein-signaling modulator 2-like [Xenia sp. Carnegie-2017]|uniref:G-protein-signaling modulator 2-like n=1 Tax=Xenia sp. Carnegie-2017 TaxID=2897299 RepID=UPI001F04B65C|nr:G-protein-signaling modulator 2-like [Xenia sp. Carnegie-2017]
MATQASCLDLALEGERLCKAGDCQNGVSYFEAAIQVGTKDLKTLSAVYSQLGNAYFFLQEYEKALDFHRQDLSLTRTLGDQEGEAKASGNLGNTLKVLGKFDEAVVCCMRHLELSKEAGNKVLEARALYNLGNIYHAKGKHAGRSFHQDPGNFPEEVRVALEKAAEFYEENLKLVRELKDRRAQGRACGNLGNTHYLLGNFSKAILYHRERLVIAQEFSDSAAERRAYSNLGNAYVFQGKFDLATDCYKKTVVIAQTLGDRAVEAQACYSLGNTYTLLSNYEEACRNHLKHLEIAQELGDRIGEGRACWSLGNVNTSLGNQEIALEYATRHLEISKEVGDRAGQITAQMNIADLKTLLNSHEQQAFDRRSVSFTSGETSSSSDSTTHQKENKPRHLKSDSKTAEVPVVTRRSKSTTDPSQVLVEMPTNVNQTSSVHVLDDNFFELLSRCQGNRMEEQRAEMPNSKNKNGVRTNKLRRSIKGRKVNSMTQEEMFDMIVKSQESRIDDQRCDPDLVQQAPTVPDEDFFGLIMRLQSNRIDEQRCSLPENRRNQNIAKDKGTQSEYRKESQL